MTGRPCGGPWWLGASSGAGERQVVPVMVPGGWELLLALERGRQSLVAGTALGELWEPWLYWYCAEGLWGALASLVLCWGAVGSPGFTGTVLGAVGSPGFAGTVLGAMGSPGFAVTLLGGCGEPWLHWET